MAENKNAWDIWVADVPFENSDGHKIRPVIILEDSDDSVQVVQMMMLTTHTPRLGEYALRYWRESGLHRPTTARISKIIDLPQDSFSYKIGTLNSDDIEEIYRLLTTLNTHGENTQ
ncbi:MAG: type II toxin-antitoxin system PemK/MazF family toxin [Oscillospiraceae bacterium]|jgi:mRNA interferase MazF|nr:type II toxin-antitoxin system PemK/MazF family toxin [Oscillospiraceae bacterium]